MQRICARYAGRPYEPEPTSESVGINWLMWALFPISLVIMINHTHQISQCVTIKNSSSTEYRIHSKPSWFSYKLDNFIWTCSTGDEWWRLNGQMNETNKWWRFAVMKLDLPSFFQSYLFWFSTKCDVISHWWKITFFAEAKMPYVAIAYYSRAGRSNFHDINILVSSMRSQSYLLHGPRPCTQCKHASEYDLTILDRGETLHSTSAFIAICMQRIA